MRGEFWYWDMSQSAMILDRKIWLEREGGLSMRKPPPHGQRSTSEFTALTSSFDRNNSDGKVSLKQQKTPETTTDTQDASKCYWFYV